MSQENNLSNSKNSEDNEGGEYIKKKLDFTEEQIREMNIDSEKSIENNEIDLNNMKSNNENYQNLLNSNKLNSNQINELMNILKNENEEIIENIKESEQSEQSEEKEIFDTNNDNILIKEKINLITSEIKIFNDVQNLNEFNRNLFIINSLKKKNLELYYEEMDFFNNESIKMKLNNRNYYSNLLNTISENLNKNNEEEINFSEKITNKDSNYKKLLSQNKIQRYRKNKDELNYLEDFYLKNRYRWNSKIINELSEKLFLSKYSIYKWNWDRQKRDNINN